uniref:Uncharacterized protein n=1 Tax=Rhizophora mucronata TaxID=61149 RepID=A0A2P2NCK0_RHIMU
MSHSTYLRRFASKGYKLRSNV